jgi:hypothetical protein
LLRGDFPLLGRGGRDAVIRGQEGYAAVGPPAVLRLHNFKEVPDNRFT